MEEEEQRLYDKLIIAIPKLDAGLKEDAFKINRDGMLLAVGRDRDDFNNKDLYDHVMEILNMICRVDIKEDTGN